MGRILFVLPLSPLGVPQCVVFRLLLGVLLSAAMLAAMAAELAKKVAKNRLENFGEPMPCYW